MVIMKELNKNLSEMFNIEPLEQNVSTQIVETEDIKDDDEIEADYKLARKNIRNLINKGDIAIDELIDVAKESEHPRAYEVVANLIKTMADLNKDLMDIQKKRKDLSGKKIENNPDSPITVDKAVFVGSTKDLIKMIKNNKEE